MSPFTARELTCEVIILSMSNPSSACLSPASSSSSSPSSSNSALPESRSSTPFSDVSNAPETFVYLPSPYFNPSTLRRAFEKHCASGSLRIVIDNSNDEKIRYIDEHKKRWTACDEYFVSTEYDYPEHSSTLISTDPVHAQQLFTISLASLRSVYALPLSSTHTLHVLERPAFSFLPFSKKPTFTPDNVTHSKLGGNIPTPEEWRTLWSAWDLVTLQMIPQEMLHQKPIDLRHKCLFYIGHIPTFLDMLMSKAIGGGPTEPKHFWNIFERGIDPHVDDPDHCHNHSEVPEKDEDWPTIDSIIGFRDGVRARLMRLYDDLKSGVRPLTRNIARTLVMTIEHEGWHVETLLYMLLQRAGTGTLPPPGFTTPSWEVLVRQWNSIPAPSTPTVLIGPAIVTLGHEDSEALDQLPEFALDVEGRTFGWDNESPARTTEVKAFKADWRPVTNGEFMSFWRGASKGCVEMPKSWVMEDGEVKVRTMYGYITMQVAQHWPVLTAYDDLVTYAHSKGGRLPTEPELRLFLDTYDVSHEDGANVGFRNWHPVPATMGIEEYAGKGSNGGVWEWTSTAFDGHEGLAPTNLFTGYSTDFFDTKHQVVLGASYATIPRLASRRTVRNFYQHNYPYPWVGARVVYDL
ncbi:C-type lectin protein [Crucibulum laeve]|uniref:C-type lectin protein n=1 Tax=Crucibulum laeve TaxID=68775 RepID=A0A5C3MGS7_9AGAR|nr:C-type lectin protein [Crucibulum laeve]